MTEPDDAMLWLEGLFDRHRNASSAQQDIRERMSHTFTVVREHLVSLGADSRTLEAWAATYINVADQEWPGHRIVPVLRAALEEGFQVALRRDESGEWQASTRPPM
jgi:hypothetical protein